MSTTANAQVEALLRRVRTVLLDFDGPVCAIFAGYPAPTVADDLAAILTRANYPVPRDYLRTQDPLDVLRYAGTLGPDLTELVERQLNAAEVTAAATAEATAGAEAFLTACRLTGRAVAVVSNNSSASVTRFLERAGWLDLVRLVRGRDPSDPSLMKPHPQVLLRSLRDLPAPAESAAIVGDSVTGVEAGLAAEVWTIGYANNPGKDEALREAGADVVAASMATLADLIARAPVR